MDRRATQSEPVLATFAISMYKTPLGKRHSHGDHKEHKGTDDHGLKGHSNGIRLSDLCDLRV
jgi:hypothetical protein